MICEYCGQELIPGEGEEADMLRAVGLDGKLRYFCSSSDDALHHARVTDG